MTTKLRENIEALLEYIFATEGDSYEEYLQDNDDGSDHVFQIAAETRVLLNEEMGAEDDPGFHEPVSDCKPCKPLN